MKNNGYNIIELFSGIGGFTQGFIDAGYKIDEHYFSEIDKHAIANYKYNFQNAKYIGSVTDISGRDFTGIDIITFGSPCQDFSLAGKRKGLEGSRSSLIEYAIKIISELRPNIFIWENVKGAFSSNAGADFWAILQAFANIGGYRLEWQLLNTKWFLPQNRERIYLVGHLDGRSKPGVFPIGENDDLHSERGAVKQETNSIASTLMAGHHKSQTGNFLLCDSGKNRQLEKREIMPPLRANTGAGHGNYIVGAIRGRNNEKTATKKTKQMLEINKEGISNTLTSVQKDNVVVGTWRDYKGEVGLREMEDNLCPTLLARAMADGSGQPAIKNENSIRRLTEIECERLQGFPDNWTEYGNYDGNIKKIPKTQRYKMLGNAVTVRVVEEIAKRIEIL